MSSFLENLRRRAGEARDPAPAGPKAPEEMTPEEREKELERLRWEKEKAEVKAIVYGRQYLGESGASPTPRRPSPFGREPRRPFK